MVSVSVRGVRLRVGVGHGEQTSGWRVWFAPGGVFLGHVIVVAVLASGLASLATTALVAVGIQRAGAVPAPGLTTLAGSGALGHGDGAGTSATFDSLVDLTVDPSGTYLYALDAASAGSGLQPTIRRITIATQAVSTFASGGLLGSATHIDADGQGRVYVAVSLSGDEKGIVRYPSGGGTPTTVVSNICCGQAGGPGNLGDAITLNPAGSELYYVSRLDRDDTGNFPQQGVIRRLAVAGLPADGGGPPVNANLGVLIGGAGHLLRDPVIDMEFGPDGGLFVIWPGSEDGGEPGYPPQLWRFDVSAPGTFSLVRGGSFIWQNRLAFAAGSSSAYFTCRDQSSPDNGCRGSSLLIRRSGFGAGEAVNIAGSVDGFQDGSPGQMRGSAGLAMAPDGTTIYIADWGNRRIRGVLSVTLVEHRWALWRHRW